jgi:hypothetical protein
MVSQTIDETHALITFGFHILVILKSENLEIRISEISSAILFVDNNK